MSDLVPEGWMPITLSSISEHITKGATPTTYGFGWEKSGIIFLRSECVKNSKFTLSGAEYISDEAHESMKRSALRGGDVLVSITGYIGQACILPMYIKKANMNQHIARIRVQDKDTSIFIMNYLNSEPQQREFRNIQTGQAYPQLSLKQIQDIEISFPPLPELQKIAAILTSIDEVIEKTQVQINKFKDLKAGMMQQLLTSGIGVDGKPHTEFKDSVVGRVPEGWKVKALEGVVERVIDCEHKTAPYVDKSEYLVVRTSNVRNGELVLEGMKYTHADGYTKWTSRAVPALGDVIFTREAPAGQSCLVPDNLNVCLGQRMVLLRPNTDEILPHFFSLLLTSEAVAKSIYELSIGTTVSRINIEDIKRIPCVLPPLEEQLKISKSIQSIQTTLSSNQDKLGSMKKIKKALMQDLLTGKVRVTLAYS